MAEEGVEEPISLPKIKNASPRRRSELPTLLRQQAGVELVGIKDENLLPLAPDYAEEKQKANGELEKELGLWITSQETGLFPQVVTSERELGTSMGLVRVLRKVQKMVGVYFEQGGERRRKLVELVKQDESVKEETALSLAKIRILLPLTQGSLHSSLENIEKFLTKDLCPVLGIEPGEELGNKPKAGYQEKARRLLTGEKRVRASHLLKVLAEKQVLRELPFQLEEEVLRLATSVNHLKLLEFLEEKGIDLAETKDKLRIVLQDLGRKRGTNSGKITAEETPSMNAVLELVAPISNLIRQEFPHDTAYLLSQILEKKQAICSGKSLMLAMVLNDLGLDARYVAVLISSDSDFDGRHAECQVNLPGNIIFALDLNYPKNWTLRRNFVFGEFSHQVGLIVPDRDFIHQPEEFSEPKVPIPLGSIREKEGIVNSIVYGSVHRLTTQAEKLPELLHNNLSWFYYECYELQGLDPKEKLRFLQRSKELNRKVIEISPSDADGYYNLGLDYTEESRFVFGDERINCARAAERCFQRAIHLQPKFALAFSHLGDLYLDYLDIFSSSWEKHISTLREAEEFFLRASTIDPKEPAARFSLGLLYREYFFWLTKSKREQVRLLESAIKQFQYHNELVGKPEDEWVIKANSHIKEIVGILAERSLKWKLLRRLGLAPR